MSARSTFATRLREGQPLVGTFQKLPSHQIVELFGKSGLDFIVLDNEHAPFDPSQIDTCVLASHAVDVPLIVRIRSGDAPEILSVLDMGAVGIFAPHVVSGEMAARIMSSALYRGGSRGFSPSTRAGDYGARGLDAYMDEADREVAVILQIEDGAALTELDAIASAKGVAGLFVGRADLAASLGVDWNDPAIDEATKAVAQAAARHGIAAGSYLADADRVSELRNWGISFFVLGSDQGILKTALSGTALSFKSAILQQDTQS